MEKGKRLIVLSSPSGGGKTTVAQFLMKKYPRIRFSISATTRKKRAGEKDGRDYYFLEQDEFRQKIDAGGFVEYEEIFGNYYGTLHSEIDRAVESDEILLFDVDVKGAISLREAYPELTLTIFLIPPDMEELEKRLRKRDTENEEQLQTRLARSEMEMELGRKGMFDHIIINSILEETLRQVDEIVKNEITGLEK